MKKNKIVLSSLLHSLITVIYIFGVACLMNSGEKLFGQIDSILGVVAFLLLFTLSVAIVGLLILGKPVKLYLDKDKKEALKFLFWTLAWLILIAIIIFVVLILI